MAAPPLVLAVGGLAGSGKSTLARALAPGLGARLVRSDVVRKALFHVPPERPLGAEGYGPATDARVAASLCAAVRAGGTLVLDATFRSPALRDAVAAAASEAGSVFRGVWLVAPLAERERRVAARHGDASDADAAVVRAQADTGVPEGWAAVEARDAAAALKEVRRLLGML